MARKKILNTKSFTENLHVYIESQLSDLEKINIPKTFTRITSEDETIEGTPKITPMDIKKLCEINK